MASLQLLTSSFRTTRTSFETIAKRQLLQQSTDLPEERKEKTV